MNSRRRFLVSTLALGGVSLLYLNRSRLTIFDNSVQVMLETAYTLYPASALGFGARDVALAHYLAGVMADRRILPADQKYLRDGSRWIEEEAHTVLKKSFLHATPDERESLLQHVATYPWGENYLTFLLGYVFEAMFSAPVYGSNHNGMGWAWVGHDPGFPQPQTREEITYG